MSMISAQIDELRELAGDGSMEWVAGPIRASVLRDAADTIWQLRDDLQRTHGLLGKADHEGSRAWDRVRKAEAENAKLRELVRDMYKAFMHGNCYRWCEFKEPCNFIEDGRCQWYDRMRELGIEVE